MVRIRLRRVGAKKQPHYRVVVADQRSPRDGRHIETIGFYNPRTEPETLEIQEDRALYWLSNGAKPSEVVLQMLEKRGTMARLSRLHAGESIEALVAEYEAQVDTEVEGADAAAGAVEEATEPVEAEEETVEPEGTIAEAQVDTEVEGAEAVADAAAGAVEEATEPVEAEEETVEPEGTIAEAQVDTEVEGAEAVADAAADAAADAVEETAEPVEAEEEAVEPEGTIAEAQVAEATMEESEEE